MTPAARPPRVAAVEPLADAVLRVTFDNNVVKTYDMKPLLSLPLFKPLESPDIFQTVIVEPGGYAVVWGDIADVSEYELWQHGIEQS